MNIKELKEKIKDLPDDMPVGGVGHFGEFLDVNYLHVTEASTKKYRLKILSISIEDAGPEPD